MRLVCDCYLVAKNRIKYLYKRQEINLLLYNFFNGEIVGESRFILKVSILILVNEYRFFSRDELLQYKIQKFIISKTGNVTTYMYF